MNLKQKRKQLGLLYFKQPIGGNKMNIELLRKIPKEDLAKDQEFKQVFEILREVYS